MTVCNDDNKYIHLIWPLITFIIGMVLVSSVQNNNQIIYINSNVTTISKKLETIGYGLPRTKRDIMFVAADGLYRVQYVALCNYFERGAVFPRPRKVDKYKLTTAVVIDRDYIASMQQYAAVFHDQYYQVGGINSVLLPLKRGQLIEFYWKSSDNSRPLDSCRHEMLVELIKLN